MTLQDYRDYTDRVRLGLIAPGGICRIEIAAPSFLPQMVRNVAGALVAVGDGRWTASDLADVLARADRRQSAPTAPPQGVILLDVAYAPTWYDV